MLTQYDIPLSTIASELGSFSNEFSSGVKFKYGTEEYDITIKEQQDTTQTRKDKNVEDLKKLQIHDQNRGSHDLQHISELVYSSGMADIRRVNQEKQIELFYSFAREAEESKDLLDSYRLEIDDIVAAYNLPSGVAIEVVHEEDNLADFKFLIIAAFILILMILASVFESVSTPFVLMFSIPLAAIGSFLALIFTQNSLFNANTLVGFLILLGIVINNGIILIDYANILHKRGYRKSRALMMAGLSRVRPILITAITTIVAMFPLAMGNAEYVGAIGAPFAITVIGGLSLSTVLTLVFIPTFYFGLDNALRWLKQLDWRIKSLHLLIYICLGAYIYLEIDSLLWQMIDFVLLVVLVPGITYFAMTSLRQAKTKLFDEKQPIRIQIQNLVKIYDRDSRFAREWKGGKNIRKRIGLVNDYSTLNDFRELLWQLPLFGFLVYFTFYYITSGLWIFIMCHAVYFFLFLLWRPFHFILARKSEKRNKPVYKKIGRIVFKAILWAPPVIFSFVLFQKWDNLGMAIFVGAIWYIALLIYISSDYIHQKAINIERITGKFEGLRRSYFRMVKRIPVIGKRRTPFKALSGVSLEIGTGMFGLLGPNGAGKSTMMRIICGIFEQSYGKVWINGFDTQKYREELQGLIGYLPQEFGTYENMSAWEFLDYQAILKGLKISSVRNERLEYVLKAVHMYDKRNDKIGSFSGGMKQRIGIAQILIHLPRILVVDEPTAGLDPRERIRFRNLLVELSRDRIVIFSTHIIEDISSSCNQVAVINKGEVKYTGTPQDMIHLGKGFVWQFTIPAREFNAMAKQHMVVNHMRDGDDIKVRCIAKEQPAPDAIQVQPHLEDAYLCLLKDIRND